MNFRGGAVSHGRGSGDLKMVTRAAPPRPPPAPQLLCLLHLEPHFDWAERVVVLFRLLWTKNEAPINNCRAARNCPLQDFARKLQEGHHLLLVERGTEREAAREGERTGRITGAIQAHSIW